MKLLLYCTKEKNKLDILLPDEHYDKKFYLYSCPYENFHYQKLNGTIVAECECDFVEKVNCCCIPYKERNNLGYEHFLDNGVYKVDWKNGVNLTFKEYQYNDPKIYKNHGVVFERNGKRIDTMLKNEDFKKICLTAQELLDYINLGNYGYLLHFKNVKLFNQPRNLNYYGLEKAPQNMMKVCEKDDVEKTSILISIRPEHLIKILNGEKSIEVRRQILKELKELLIV